MVNAQNRKKFSAKQYLRNLLLALPEEDLNRKYYLDNTIFAHNSFQYFKTFWFRAH